MSGPEATIERQCVKEAKGAGWRVFKLRFLDQVGAPDRLFGRRGEKPLMVEFKAPGETATPIQKIVHGWLRGMGFRVWVIDSEEEFRRKMGWRR